MNYVEHLFILPSEITGCISMSGFASLVATPLGITNSAVGKIICPIIAGIKKYKSIMKKKKKKYDKIVLLGKDKLTTIEVLISKVLIDSYISHEEFVSVKNMLRAMKLLWNILYQNNRSYYVSCIKYTSAIIKYHKKLNKID